MKCVRPKSFSAQQFENSALQKWLKNWKINSYTSSKKDTVVQCGNAEQSVTRVFTIVVAAAGWGEQ
eukprot:gene24952-10832_t